jgi:hypothetical protein
LFFCALLPTRGHRQQKHTHGMVFCGSESICILRPGCAGEPTAGWSLIDAADSNAHAFPELEASWSRRCKTWSADAMVRIQRF